LGSILKELKVKLIASGIEVNAENIFKGSNSKEVLLEYIEEGNLKELNRMLETFLCEINGKIYEED